MLKTKNRCVRKKKINYPILTVVLFLTLIYVGINAMGNVIKLVSFNYKLMKLEVAYANAQKNNYCLREEIASYSKPDIITYKVVPQKSKDENLRKIIRF